DEGTGEIVRSLRRVDNRWTGRDEIFEVIHQRHALADGLLHLLTVGNVGPRSYNLGRPAVVVVNDFEGVLYPDVLPVSMPETIFERPSPLIAQTTHRAAYAPGSL